MKLGDFTSLVKSYSENRPGYSNTVRDSLLRLTRKNFADIDAADVGAGTGIWSRQLAAAGLKSLIAVEPNDAMRQAGKQDSEGHAVEWQSGSGENTTLDTDSVDFLSMASSFHWVDFEKGTAEFSRVLKKDGWFVALWNTREFKGNPLLEEIEHKIVELKPDLKRVSSGGSGASDTLEQDLIGSRYFEDVIYTHGHHVEHWSLDRYIGAWRSVNDVQAQLGTEKFKAFIDFIKEKTSQMETIEVAYTTRAWAARNAG